VSRVRVDGPFRRAVAGAAAGGLVLAVLSIVEMGRASTPLAEPWVDLSRVALGGAAAGFVLGLLRGPLPWLSPGAVVLGGALALRWALDELSGSVLSGPGAAATLLRAVGVVAGGALLGAGIGSVAVRRLPRGGPGLGLNLAVVALLALPLLLARRPAGASGGPNVLLLTIDTLREDRLGLTGCPVPTSPHLDRLARRGLVRTRAVTPLPRTLPAVASLHTGCFPHTHGVRDNFHYALGDAAVTLAEILSREGWATAAVNSNPLLSHDSGVYQGFASASDRGDDWSHLDLVRGFRRLATLAAMRGDRAQVITDLALAWLRGRPRGAPFFLWVHWLAPHMPYEPAPPFDRRFDPGYEGRFATRLDYDEISKGEMTYRNPLTPAEREHAKTLYDGEVATADRALGRLLREMELAGDLDDTIVLVTSDHGESLDEHGYFFNHGDFVYGPAADVPLIRVTPEGAPGLDATPVSLIDVAPELLALLDLAGEDEGMDGRVPAPGPHALFGESGFCRFPQLNERLGYLLPPEIAQSPDRIPDWTRRWEAQANRAKQRFVQADRWKLVLSPRPDGDRAELFDLESDAGEQHDLTGTPGAAGAPADSLRAGLAAWIEAGNLAAGTADARELTDEQRARLDALGYLGN